MSLVEIKDGQFFRNGTPHKIIGGSLHYFRVHPALWEDRIARIKTMGCNTIETYVPWALHEKRRGVFDFSGPLDLPRFLTLIRDAGMDAIVRPSPYICAEFDFGGLPPFLLDKPMRIRSSDRRFLTEVMRYYDHLLPVLLPFQDSPIIMMQVENEYGSYGSDVEYMEALRTLLVRGGVTVPLFTSDNTGYTHFHDGSLSGILPAANYGSVTEAMESDRKKILKERIGNDGPLFCAEFWCGWFDSYRDAAHHTTDAKKTAEELEKTLRKGSVNIYMAHGGTNFGYMAGANQYDTYAPDVTSYDYDAPIAEDGTLTEKFFLMRETIGKHTKLPDLNKQLLLPTTKDYGTFPVTGEESLFALLSHMKGKRRRYPETMEEAGEPYGFICYSYRFQADRTMGSIQLDGGFDRTQCFLNGKRLAIWDETECDRKHLFDPPVALKKGDNLLLVTEQQARVNYGVTMSGQWKGIRNVFLNDTLLSGFTEQFISTLPVISQKETENGTSTLTSPLFATFSFNLDHPQESTWLDLSAWGKGVAWCNGWNLGRYWDKGPQKALFVPGPVLRDGTNEVTLCNMEGKTGETITFRRREDAKQK
mgnify:CR=1 FL=1